VVNVVVTFEELLTILTMLFGWNADLNKLASDCSIRTDSTYSSAS
jgi:hypothetical protein